jgi:hypothetical protein
MKQLWQPASTTRATYSLMRCRRLNMPLPRRSPLLSLSDGRPGKLLAAKVGRIPANGHLAEIGKTKYGWTTNESPAACRAALTLAGQAAKPKVTVACDRAPTYPGLVASSFPAGVSVAPYKSRSLGSSADFDPLFKLNHACAKIRADLACMARKTWATTKKRRNCRIDWTSTSRSTTATALRENSRAKCIQQSSFRHNALDSQSRAGYAQ